MQFEVFSLKFSEIPTAPGGNPVPVSAPSALNPSAVSALNPSAPSALKPLGVFAVNQSSPVSQLPTPDSAQPPSVISVAKNKLNKSVSAISALNPSAPSALKPLGVFSVNGLRGSKIKNNSFSAPSALKSHRAFSLMEILFSIGILAVGLIMVAGIFPVAVKWTAENAQSTVGAVIAQNAFAVIKSNIQSAQTDDQSPFNTYYQAGLWGSQPYAFGANQPDAPSAGAQPLYYWTAFLQLGPGASAASGFQAISSASLYRVYIFVFARDDPNNLYTPQSGGSGNGSYLTFVEQQPGASSQTPAYTPYPQIYSGVLDGTDKNGRTGSVLPNSSSLQPGATCPMPIGSLGLDFTTGAVFRLTISPSGTFTTLPPINPNDDVLYTPAATGNTAGGGQQTDSPLIYIYTGTVSF